MLVGLEMWPMPHKIYERYRQEIMAFLEITGISLCSRRCDPFRCLGVDTDVMVSAASFVDSRASRHR